MKLFSKTLLLLPLLLGWAFVNAQPSAYVEGTHYQELDNPVRTSDPNKIEVTEVFWYGCPHCYSFEPLLENWEAGLQDDVVFVRSPGMWNEIMETHAQIFYTARTLGVLEETHEATFDAIHQRGNYLQSKEAARRLFSDHGVDPSEFDKAWDSFAVSSAVRRASSRMRDYGVRGVPSMIVNGKYRVSSGNAVPTQADMLEVVDFLIEKERQADTSG